MICQADQSLPLFPHIGPPHICSPHGCSPHTCRCCCSPLTSSQRCKGAEINGNQTSSSHRPPSSSSSAILRFSSSSSSNCSNNAVKCTSPQLMLEQWNSFRYVLTPATTAASFSCEVATSRSVETAKTRRSSSNYDSSRPATAREQDASAAPPSPLSSPSVYRRSYSLPPIAAAASSFTTSLPALSDRHPNNHRCSIDVTLTDKYINSSSSTTRTDSDLPLRSESPQSDDFHCTSQPALQYHCKRPRSSSLLPSCHVSKSNNNKGYNLIPQSECYSSVELSSISQEHDDDCGCSATPATPSDVDQNTTGHQNTTVPNNCYSPLLQHPESPSSSLATPTSHHLPCSTVDPASANSCRKRRGSSSSADRLCKRPIEEALAEAVAPLLTVEAAERLLPHWKGILLQWDSLKNKAELRRTLTAERKARFVLHRHPILTLYHFWTATSQLLHSFFSYCISHSYTRFFILPLLFTVLVLRHLPGPHEPLISSLFFLLAFASWWICLGIVSSLGLGCGLHTGVLFLLPYIFSVVLTSEKCNSMNFDPRISMWSQQQPPGHVFECQSSLPPDSSAEPDFRRLLLKCLPAALLWGFGTAIGEIPPYAASYAAVQGRLSDLEDLDTEFSTVKRFKQFFLRSMFSLIQRYGALAVFLLSAWPNALFDVCGIICGHFMMPFWSFFTALVLGKGLVKVLMQVSLTIFILAPRFDKKRAHLIAAIAGSGGWLKGGPVQFEEFIVHEIQKLRSYATAASSSASVNKSSVVAVLVAVVASLFTGYFLLTLVEQAAQARVQRFDDKLVALAQYLGERENGEAHDRVNETEFRQINSKDEKV